MKKINIILFFLYLFTYSSHGFTVDLQINYMASLCSSCHTNAQNSSSLIPPLAGYDKKKFLNFFSNLKKSNDKNKVMYQIAQGYTQVEIKKLADFFSRQE